MKIQVDDIPQDGVAVSLDEEHPDLAPILVELNEGGDLFPVRCDLALSRDGIGVTVKGTLVGAISLICSRCLCAVRHPLDEQFVFFLRNAMMESDGPGSDEFELGDEAMDYAFLEEEGVDIPAMAKEQLVLALPSKPLCATDCKGICQGCGIELNRESCRCQQGPVDSRFSVLQTLKVS